ncbi:HAAS signaling domain-containing protein [Bacillus infantis]|nr:hypothetical protein [Bacillus infantis]
MNLIELYIQEVARRLPEGKREDIGLELRSTIEDMLPDNYGEKDVKEVLAKLGSPARLAANYMDRPMHLIGPRYFDVYVHLIKLILPIAAVIAFLANAAVEIMARNTGESALDIILAVFGTGIWGMLGAGIQTLFWLTLVFAVIERTDKGNNQEPVTDSLQKWTPDDLKNVPQISREKRIPKHEPIAGLIMTIIFAALYFNADRIIGLYEQGGAGLEFRIPVFQQDILNSYWPIVMAAVFLELVLILFKWMKGQWTKGLAILTAASQAISLAAFILIFSNSAVWNKDFTGYMDELFHASLRLEHWVLWGGIVSIIVFGAIEVYHAFRKSRIR